jgi:16S rRNA (guanine527-N7)-methyltransferase
VPLTATSLTDRARVAAGLDVSPVLADRLVTYYTLLERWNRTINLTSLANEDEAIDRLLLEPIAAARDLRPGVSIMDLGSGGGSPAIPLALALGSPLLVMVESRARKAAFLREAAREVGLPARVENVRFEDLPVESIDLVTVRAVRVDRGVLELAGRFVKPGGQLALFRTAGGSVPEELPEALRWAKTVPLLQRAELQVFERI